jgi:pilus assembly protein CpaC
VHTLDQERTLWRTLIFALTITFCLTTLAAASPYSPAELSETTAPPAATTQAHTAASPALPDAQASPAPGPGSQQGIETVHIVVGHSLLIHTASRVRRILTGNPAVVESVVTSPEELVVTAKLPGSSSLMLWDEHGKSRSLDVYSDLDVSSLRNSVDQAFPHSNVDVQAEGNKVILVGTAANKDVADQMLKMASNFSKDVINGLNIAPPALIHPKQVMLKVRFAEADRAKLSQWGFNLFSTGATGTIGTVSTQQFGPLALQQGQNGGTAAPKTPTQFSLADLLNIFIFRPDINLGATIKALQQKNVLQILAEPDLMAISGQPADFLAGGEFPYPIVQGGTAGSVPAITIQFHPYGVKLKFIGTIADDGTIHLKVAPEVSSLDYTNAITISGFTMPAIQTRRAETEIELKNGQSFGIAGLLDQRTTVQLSKIPGIGDVPILGELFKSRNVNLTNTELLVLVTPTIVDPVGGEVPSTGAQVSLPTKNLDVPSFDKGLPDGAKNPEVIK